VKTADVATTLFPLWTVLFTGIALKSPQSFAWFTTEYFTAALAALMLSMGITLTPQDFMDVASEPTSVLMQFSLCYAMMPFLAFGLAKLFGIDSALLAGMVLVGSINGGQASNLCTYIAKGNVALSVLMTTATTLGAIFMTPFICKSLLGAVVPVNAAGIAKSTIEVSIIS
jgi:BASS family bile acid:Na+ symporter